MFGWLTERRRRHLLDTPFPDAWRAHLEVNVGSYALLDDVERARLRDLVQVFVAEKTWQGCGGLELTDTVRVTIAGMACVMLLGRDHALFAGVAAIVIYPSTIAMSQEHVRQRGSNRIVHGAHDGHGHGHATPGGPIVLAWDAVTQDARDPVDGRNLVIHEFAHEIDFLDGRADGTPPLEREARRAWAATLQAAFDKHRERAARGRASLLRDYAIASPAEYFAVASESFFERPHDLARELPDVYAAFRDYFNLDFAARPLPAIA